MVRLYTIDLPDADAGQPQDRIGSQVRQSGLIDGGGTATEQIATENVDLTLQGQWRYGKRFAKKAARELESLAAGGYESLPLFDVSSDELGRKTGYYEIESVDVSPAREDGEDVFEFTVGVSDAGTREEVWRAVRTTQELVDTLFDGSDVSYVAIPSEATKAQWFDSQEGTEKANPVDTVGSEFGSVDRYDPNDSVFDNPTLLYELPFEREGRVDAKVWDDRNRAKFWTFEDNGDTVDVNQWPHVFNTAWEFDGSPVIDTGRLRLRIIEDPDDNEANADVLNVQSGETVTIQSGETETFSRAEVNGTLDVQGTLELTGDDIGDASGLVAEEWDSEVQEWQQIELPNTSWSVLDADLTVIGPSEVQVQLTWTDGESNVAVDGVFDRGDNSVLWVSPEGEPISNQGTLTVDSGETVTVSSGETRTEVRADVNGTLDVQGTLVLDPETEIPNGILDVLEPIARKTETNVAPAQTTIARSEARR